MENIENCNEDVYDIELLKRHIFTPIYCFSKKIGIPQLDYMNDSKSKISKIFFFLLLIPLICTFIYHIVIGHNYQFLRLKSQENSLISLYYIHAIIALVVYNNLKNTNFFITFIKYFKEYKEIQLTSAPPLQRNFTKIKIKFFIFWFLFFATFLYDTIINFINYDEHINSKKNYKLSMFYGKTTYIFDVLIMLYAKIIVVLSATIYSCIYEVLYFEAEFFNKESQEFLEKKSLDFSEKLDLISIKHAKLYKTISFSHQIIGKYTDFAIFNCTMMIIFGISVYRYYNSTVSNTIQALQYFLPLICLIYLEVIVLLPICFMDKNLQNIKNTILNNSFIWDTKNSKLHGTALSIVTRSDHCEYHGLLMGLIPFNDKTIPILLIVVVVLSSLLGIAVL